MGVQDGFQILTNEEVVLEVVQVEEFKEDGHSLEVDVEIIIRKTMAGAVIAVKIIEGEVGEIISNMTNGEETEDIITKTMIITTAEMIITITNKVIRGRITNKEEAKVKTIEVEVVVGEEGGVEGDIENSTLYCDVESEETLKNLCQSSLHETNIACKI